MRFEAEVKRGADLLDQKLPGWEDKINLDVLDIYSCIDCVLGQLGGYTERLVTVGLDTQKSKEYGFAVKCEGEDDRWCNRDVTNAWRAEITRRLEERKELQELVKEVEEAICASETK